MSKSGRRNYNGDYKKEALSLSKESGRNMAEVEKSLGLPAGTVGRWKRQLESQGSLAFPGQGIEALSPEQKRIRELEKRLRDSQMEHEILKKAVAIFSKAPK